MDDLAEPCCQAVSQPLAASPRTRQIRCVETWHQRSQFSGEVRRHENLEVPFPLFLLGLYKIPKVRMWFFIEAINLIINFIVALSQNLVVAM